jgi:hypothetical protein
LTAVPGNPANQPQGGVHLSLPGFLLQIVGRIKTNLHRGK